MVSADVKANLKQQKIKEQVWLLYLLPHFSIQMFQEFD